jgi:hypothetical protein
MGFEPVLPIDATAGYKFYFDLSTIKNLAYGFTTPVLVHELIKKLET